MLKGGYKIIDLKDTNLTSSAVVIAGIYDIIENSYRKPLLLSGIVIDGVEKNDAFVNAVLNEIDYVINVYGGNITITADNEVTYEEEEN